MSLKILGGIARGFPLAVPRSDATKPTSVIIKRKLFDWRQNLEGHLFIDLCAGSGAMGLEALSRGAEKVFLNDLEKSPFITLKNNSEAFKKAFRKEDSVIKVTQLTAEKWIEREMKYELPDSEDAILFFDPPYEDHALYDRVLALIKASNYQGEVWVESDRLKGPSKEKLTGAFSSVIKVVEQGDHFVVIGKVV